MLFLCHMRARTELSKVEKVCKQAPVLVLAPYKDGVEVDIGGAHHLRAYVCGAGVESKGHVPTMFNTRTSTAQARVVRALSER